MSIMPMIPICTQFIVIFILTGCAADPGADNDSSHVPDGFPEGDADADADADINCDGTGDCWGACQNCVLSANGPCASQQAACQSDSDCVAFGNCYYPACEEPGVDWTSCYNDCRARYPAASVAKDDAVNECVVCKGCKQDCSADADGFCDDTSVDDGTDTGGTLDWFTSSCSQLGGFFNSQGACIVACDTNTPCPATEQPLWCINDAYCALKTDSSNKYCMDEIIGNPVPDAGQGLSFCGIPCASDADCPSTSPCEERFSGLYCNTFPDSDECTKCLNMCQGLSSCCTGCGCICEDECGMCFE